MSLSRSRFGTSTLDPCSFSLASIAYPGILSGVLVLKQLGKWTPGRRLNIPLLFRDGTSNLLGERPRGFLVIFGYN